MAFKLEENEYIIIFARRHWYTPVIKTLAILFSLLIPIFVSSIVFAFPDINQVAGNTSLLSLIFLTTWVFVAWNATFIVWTNHFLDVLIITNFHIIDIEQIGLWNREISTLHLRNVQDISSNVVGFIPSLLNYGDLEIQTAGNMNNFIVRGLQRPDLVRQKINSQIIARV